MSQFLGFSKYTMSGQLTSKIPRSSLDLAQVQDCLEIPLLGHLQYWLPNHRHVWGHYSCHHHRVHTNLKIKTEKYVKFLVDSKHIHDNDVISLFIIAGSSLYSLILEKGANFMFAFEGFDWTPKPSLDPTTVSLTAGSELKLTPLCTWCTPHVHDFFATFYRWCAPQARLKMQEFRKWGWWRGKGSFWSILSKIHIKLPSLSQKSPWKWNISWSEGGSTNPYEPPVNPPLTSQMHFLLTLVQSTL